MDDAQDSRQGPVQAAQTTPARRMDPEHPKQRDGCWQPSRSHKPAHAGSIPAPAIVSAQIGPYSADVVPVPLNSATLAVGVAYVAGATA